MHFSQSLRRNGREKARIVENMKISEFLDNFFGGVGCVGNPKSLKVHGFPYFFYDFCGGVGAWENQNH